MIFYLNPFSSVFLPTQFCWGFYLSLHSHVLRGGRGQLCPKKGIYGFHELPLLILDWTTGEYVVYIRLVRWFWGSKASGKFISPSWNKTQGTKIDPTSIVSKCRCICRWCLHHDSHHVTRLGAELTCKRMQKDGWLVLLICWSVNLAVIGCRSWTKGNSPNVYHCNQFSMWPFCCMYSFILII